MYGNVRKVKGELTMRHDYDWELASKVFEDCKEVMSDRNGDYGPYREFVKGLARSWSVIAGTELSEERCLLMMAQLKLLRCVQGFKKDSYVDGINYLAMACEVGRQDKVLEEEAGQGQGGSESEGPDEERRGSQGVARAHWVERADGVRHYVAGDDLYNVERSA